MMIGMPESGRPSASRRPREGSPGLNPKKNCWKWSQVSFLNDFELVLNGFKIDFYMIFYMIVYIIKIPYF